MAIESSATHGSVALGCAGTIVAEVQVEAGRRQSEVLLGPLGEILNEARGEPVTGVVVGTGPGSYNGARVGIAAGQGVALVHGCPVAGLPSLEAIPAGRDDAACLAVGDARRGTFFTLELREGRLSPEPDLLESEEFLQRLRAGLAGGKRIVTLESPTRLPLPEDLAGRVELQVPTARLLLEAWWARSPAEQEAVTAIPPEPYYLRPPHITKPRRPLAGPGTDPV